MARAFKHTPVMLNEVLRCLSPKSGDVFLDCTLGGAGHAFEVAKEIGPSGILIGIDQDSFARKAATNKLDQLEKTKRPKVFIEDVNFAQIDDVMLDVFRNKSVSTKNKIPGLDLVLFDLGVSSFQLDTQERGFTYHENAPLDMRMNQDKEMKSAKVLINELSEGEIERILRVYGEEKFSKKIAKKIVCRREEKMITKSDELVEIVKNSIPAAKRRSGGHPAKRTFQAFRIAVNDELASLEKGLDAAVRWLNPGGKICVISYHSLEDRLVKEAFMSLENRCICDVEAPICKCGREPILKRNPRSALVPTEQELAINPRARSAKLRCAIKQ